jgi:hypothetical protein
VKNNSPSIGGTVGFLFAFLTVFVLFGFGVVSGCSHIRQWTIKQRYASGGGVADFVWDKHCEKNPNICRELASPKRGPAPTWNATSLRVATSHKGKLSSENGRCIGNPYAQPASETFGVPLALIECVHFAESSCRSNEAIHGKYQAWDAVLNLRKPTKQRHALRAIADDLGVHESELRSNRVGAMGPFQFIPTTWISNGIDADGNNDVSPYSLADSTFAMANMFAKVKANKGSWQAAIARYNSKQSYVDRIMACARL